MTATAFVQTPMWVLTHPELDGSAVRVFGVLQSHSRPGHQVFPGIERLAEMAKLGRSCVTRCLRDLEAVGAIRRHRRSRGGRRSTNLYDVAFDAPLHHARISREDHARISREEVEDVEVHDVSVAPATSSPSPRRAQTRREDVPVTRSTASPKEPKQRQPKDERKRDEVFDAVAAELERLGVTGASGGLVQEITKRAKTTGRPPEFVAELAVRMARVERVELTACTWKERSRVLGAVGQVAGVCGDMEEIARRAAGARAAGERSVAVALSERWGHYGGAIVRRLDGSRTQQSAERLADEIVRSGAMPSLRERLGVRGASAAPAAIGGALRSLGAGVIDAVSTEA